MSTFQQFLGGGGGGGEGPRNACKMFTSWRSPQSVNDIHGLTQQLSPGLSLTPLT